MRIPVDQDALARMVARHVSAHQAASVTAARRLADITPNAADDAAGVAIATRMQARAASAAAASHNVQDGISLMQVADGALAAMTAYLDKVRVVAVQAATDTFDDTQRSALQIGVDSLLQGFDDTWRSISESTRSIQVGIDAGDTLTVPTGLDGERSWGVSVQSADSARSALDMLDEALQELYAQRAAVGAAENRLGRILESLGVQESQGAQTASRITDADLGREVIQLLRSRSWAQAGAQMLGEVTAAGRRAMEILLASAATVSAEAAADSPPATGSAAAPPASAPSPTPVLMRPAVDVSPLPAAPSPGPRLAPAGVESASSESHLTATPLPVQNSTAELASTSAGSADRTSTV